MSDEYQGLVTSNAARRQLESGETKMNLIEVVVWISGVLTLMVIVGGAFLYVYKNEWGIRLLYLSAGFGLTFFTTFIISGKHKPWFAVFLVCLFLTFVSFVISLFLRHSTGYTKKLPWIGTIIVLVLTFVSFGFTLKYDLIFMNDKGAETTYADLKGNENENVEKEVGANEEASGLTSDEEEPEENSIVEEAPQDNTGTTTQEDQQAKWDKLTSSSTLDMHMTQFDILWNAVANMKEDDNLTDYYNESISDDGTTFRAVFNENLRISGLINPSNNNFIGFVLESSIPATSDDDVYNKFASACYGLILITQKNAEEKPDILVMNKLFNLGDEPIDLSQVDRMFTYNEVTYVLQSDGEHVNLYVMSSKP